MTADRIAAAARWAALYRLRGYNPLPSRLDAKRPNLASFRAYWDAPCPPEIYEQFATGNIQLVLGRPFGLVAVDLDGPAAADRFATLGRCPATWTTHSGGAGRHLWFRVPKDGPYIPKRVVWRGEGEHSLIEVLGDRSLLVAPPSIHPKTGQMYRFASKRLSPLGMPLPAPCPSWVLALPSCDAVRLPAPAEAPAVRKIAVRRPDRLPTTREVLDAIPDKVALARQWGLRVAGRANARGWCPCHAIGREDRHPSAAIHADSGRYCDLGSGVRLGFLDLAAAIGPYRDWKDAAADLGARYLHRRTAR